MERGIAGWVAQHQEPVLLQGLVQDPRFTPVWPRPDIRSSVSMPMIVGGKLAGVLNVNVTQERRPLTLGQIKALTILVSTAASTLESSRLYRQMLEGELRCRTLVDALDDAITVKDIEGRYVTANAEFLRRTGLSTEAVLGRTASEIYDAETARQVDERDRLVLSSSDETHVEDWIRSEEGRGVYHLRKLPLRNAAGDIVGVVTVSRDVTEQKQAEENLSRSLTRLRTAMGGMVQAMATATELRDPYTAGHQRRVSILASAIARELGVAQEEVEGICRAGVIHDLGKISVPAEILSKPGRITDAELSIIRIHPQSGREILSKIEFPWPIARIVGEHHERLDGSGYPEHLTGDNICRGAKILAVADVVEAMSSHRPYRPALGKDRALEEISNQKGRLYDPEAVDACLRVFRGGGFDLMAASTMQ